MPHHQCTAATAAGHQCSNSIWGGHNLCGVHRRAANVRFFAALPPDQQQPPQPRCRHCTRVAVRDGYCAQHEELRPRPDLPVEQRCHHPRCMRIRQGVFNRCRRHEVQFVARRQNEIFQALYMRGVNLVITNHDTWPIVVADWRGQVGQPFISNELVRHLELTLAREARIPELWNHHMGDHAPMDEMGHVGWLIFDDDVGIRHPPRAQRPPPRGELEAFARDGQNVHTRVVTQHTNSSLDILLNADVPADQKTVTESHMCFMDHISLGRIKTSLDVVRDVDRDVKRWYRTGTCRQDGDFLYKRTLDGLWAKIKTSPMKRELEIRLWQEMVDSLGMCCDGHITRLANVLCGFDDAFVPELSPAEKLQNRMAVIAGMEGGIILQTAHALAAFKEFDVPRDQWEAWVDAL
uniref:Uncharacterized protein n=1 Tax=viral metagenome TaxID=1070528 RepID=A0A6C0AK57_9ZZZZ